ncbi:MAG: hypothetical protein H0T72_06360, partial [Chloroflexia bacterium]|nr:hypothetical protein [Chloroflexia bacterium]
MALAYAFLQLFPELDLAHEVLGEHVHAVTLASFLVFFALELAIAGRWSRRHRTVADRQDESPAVITRRFWFHVAIIWSYT